MSQLGRPKLVGVRKPVMASVSLLLSMMLLASPALILAVRYCGTDGQQRGSTMMRSGKTYGMDLNVVALVLGLDGLQQTLEPLEAAKVTAHPEEVNLS